MKKLKFSGIVERGDRCRCQDDMEPGAIYIGESDIVSQIEDTFEPGEKVIVGIMEDGFTGELFVETGWGYSEYTPMDSDELRVGDHDLIEYLEQREGRNITLIISDEPVNILEDE